MESITRANIPAGLRWELLVVDNGSSDDTASVIASFAPRLPVRMLTEPSPGVSKARNMGLFAAQADRIVWTDDDTEVAPEWLTSYLDAYERYPDAAFFGGKVIPVFEGGVPSWLQPNLEAFAHAFAARDLGEAPVRFRIEHAHLPFGANMALRTPVQRLFPFDPAVGGGTGISGGEETKMIRQMAAAGHHGMWVPGSAVRHHIPAARASLAYIDKFNFDTGFLIEREMPSAGPIVFGTPRWLLRDLCRSYARYRARRLVRPPAEWAPDLAKFAYARGRVSYWLSRRKQA